MAGAQADDQAAGLAVTCGESERRRTRVNLAGRLWTPVDGFEDREAAVR
jgi:hypothetical protein